MTSSKDNYTPPQVNTAVTVDGHEFKVTSEGKVYERILHVEHPSYGKRIYALRPGESPRDVARYLAKKLLDRARFENK